MPAIFFSKLLPAGHARDIRFQKTIKYCRMHFPVLGRVIEFLFACES
jgi:hypothetical protein